jgi:hypothetical protein
VEWIARQFHCTVTLMHVFEIPPAWYGMSDAYPLNADWLAKIGTKRAGEDLFAMDLFAMDLFAMDLFAMDRFAMDLPTVQRKRLLTGGSASVEIREYCQNNTTGRSRVCMMGSITAQTLHNVTAPGTAPVLHKGRGHSRDFLGRFAQQVSSISSW